MRRDLVVAAGELLAAAAAASWLPARRAAVVDPAETLRELIVYRLTVTVTRNCPWLSARWSSLTPR
jgi:hypothetical protein